MSTGVSLVLVGASGRMGREISSLVSAAQSAGEAISIIGGIAGLGDPSRGPRNLQLDCPISAGWEEDFSKADVIVDFSTPEGSEIAIKGASKHGIPILIGTTGLSEKQEEEITKLAESNLVIRAKNTSLGVNILATLVRQASEMLGNDFDAELVELHHRHKTDAPSGTALMLSDEIAKGRGESLDKVLSTGRSGVSSRRTNKEIGAQAVRGGDVVGEHTVYFFGEGERLELTHRATDRRIFAEGALKAAWWLARQRRAGVEAGNFSMLDVVRG